jgi:hypothetical protein
MRPGLPPQDARSLSAAPVNQLSTGDANQMSDAAVILNQKLILQNQKSILANQKAIKANQETIKKNQSAILKNQSLLRAIVSNQKKILARLK